MPGVLRSYQISVQDHRLHYLFVAASYGSMRAAADALGIAASSISRQIGQLERDLRIDLVETGAHKMRLTKAGQILVDYYTTRTKHHEDLIKQIGELRRNRMSVLKIAFGEGLLHEHIVAGLKTVVDKHDDTTIDLISGSSYEVQNMVHEGGAHIGIVFEVGDNVRSRIHQAISQPIRLICPAGYADPGDGMDLADLEKHRLIMPSGGLRLAEIVHSVIGDAGVTVNPVVISNALQPMIDSIKAGIGIALLPEIFVLDDLRQGSIFSRKIACPAFEQTQICIVTRPGQPLPPTGLEALTALSSALSQSRYE